MKFKIKKISTKLRQEVLFGCLILIFLSLQLSFVWDVSFDNEIEDFNSMKPLIPVKTSATLISPIFIDDTDPSNNWETFASTHIGDSWFTNATGTEGDPYIIDDVVINSGTNCIYIRHSKANFTFKNSEFTNSYPDQGILLLNVSYGHIENSYFAVNHRGGMRLIDSKEILIAGNTFDGNSEEGIFLENSHDNIIFGNRLINSDYGIGCEDSNGNIISNNIITNNRLHGLNLLESNNNTIKSNTIKNHGDFDEYGNVLDGAGLRVAYGSSYNRISENNFTDNKYCGVDLSRDSGNTTVLANNFINNSMCAINLIDTTNNNITDNTMSDSGIIFDGTWANMESTNISSTNLINNKPIYFYENRVNLKTTDFNNAGQVILIKCNNSLISSLNTSHGSIGFTLIYCRNITLLNNEASNNILYGIYSIDCINVTISGNNANDNWDCGILFEGCNNSTILNNEASYNNELLNYWTWASNFHYKMGCGIALEGGSLNSIVGNNLHFNIFNGLQLENSNSNSISGNIVSNNDNNGINLYSSALNDIIGNAVNYNAYHGIYLSSSSNNYVSDNTVSFQSGSGNMFYHIGISLSNSGQNDIIENNLAHNSIGINVGGNQNNISNNDFNDNGLWIAGNDNTISENTIANSYGGLRLNSAHNNIITKNVFNEVNSAIQLWSSDYNNITENFIDGGGGFGTRGLDFSSSSYNHVEQNEIYGVSACILEDDGCIANVFIDNICEATPQGEDNILIYFIIGGALGSAAIAIVFIRRRSIRKRSNNK